MVSEGGDLFQYKLLKCVLVCGGGIETFTDSNVEKVSWLMAEEKHQII